MFSCQKERQPKLSFELDTITVFALFQYLWILYHTDKDDILGDRDAFPQTNAWYITDRTLEERIPF